MNKEQRETFDILREILASEDVLLLYPGKENIVADALSCQNINALENVQESDAATIYSEQSLTCTIDTTDNPVNCFRNQIIIEDANSFSVDTFI